MQVSFLMQHPLWLPTPLAPLLEAVGYDPESLLLVFVAALLERPLLLYSATVSKLMPTISALAHMLSPLSFSGTFIPFLPAALHPEPSTLVNFSPTPFIIGVELQTLPVLQPLAPHVLAFNIDTGDLSGDDVLEELRGLVRAPLLQQLQTQLQRFCAPATNGQGSEVPTDDRGMQAILLSFMRDLLGVTSQRGLATSPDPVDALRANDCRVVCDLSADILRATADLKEKEATAKRVTMCQVDAFVRICSAQPTTPTCTFLAEAFQSRTVKEFLLTPHNAHGVGSFGDAAWMASDLDAQQSITEHAMALDAVQGLVEERGTSAVPQLMKARLLSPRTANFQQRFEVGVNETLLGSFPCAIHFQAALRQGVLHVSTRHVCFETSLFPAANTKLPLLRIAAVERARDPIFHVMPNAVRIALDDGGALVLGSFEDRDDAYGLLRRCVKSLSEAR